LHSTTTEAPTGRGFGIESQDEVALLRADQRARLRADTLEEVARSSARSPSIASTTLSKSAPWPLTSPAPTPAPRRSSSPARRSLSLAKPSVISIRNWCIGEPNRVGSSKLGESRRVTVEVGAQQHLHSADGTVTFALVEELVHEARSWPLSPRNRSSVRGSRPSPSAKFCRRTPSRATAARSLRPQSGAAALELGPHRIHVDRDPDALDRGEADPQRPLDQRGPFLDRAIGHERCQRRVVEDEMLDTSRSASRRTLA